MVSSYKLKNLSRRDMATCRQLLDFFGRITMEPGLINIETKDILHLLESSRGSLWMVSSEISGAAASMQRAAEQAVEKLSQQVDISTVKGAAIVITCADERDVTMMSVLTAADILQQKLEPELVRGLYIASSKVAWRYKVDIMAVG